MTLPLDLLRTLQQAPPDEAWRTLFDWAWETCRPKMSIADAANETSRRDSVLAPADLFLATAGWDLWTQYHASAPRIAERLAVLVARARVGPGGADSRRPVAARSAVVAARRNGARLRRAFCRGLRRRTASGYNAIRTGSRLQPALGAGEQRRGQYARPPRRTNG